MKEEIALPINEKTNNLTRKDIIDYYGRERLGVNIEVITQILDEFKKIIPTWFDLISRSFLSEQYKMDYIAVIEARGKILQIT